MGENSERPEGEPITFGYTNWRGEYAERRAIPLRIERKESEWHGPGLHTVMVAWDCDKEAERDFLITDMGRRADVRQEPGEVDPDPYLVGIMEKSETRTTPAPLPAGTVTEEMVEAAARKLAGALLDHVYEGDAESEWDQLATPARAALEAAFAARPAEPVAVKGLAEGAIPAWPPLKKALWDVVTGETLNDGHYINAYDLTNKLYSAAALVSAPAPGLVEARDALGETLDKDFAFWSSNNIPDSIRSKIWGVYKALSSITETGGAK